MAIKHDDGLKPGVAREGLATPGNHDLFKAKLELQNDKFSMPELGGELRHADASKLYDEFGKRLNARNANPETAGKRFSIAKS